MRCRQKGRHPEQETGAVELLLELRCVKSKVVGCRCRVVDFHVDKSSPCIAGALQIQAVLVLPAAEVFCWVKPGILAILRRWFVYPHQHSIDRSAASSEASAALFFEFIGHSALLAVGFGEAVSQSRTLIHSIDYHPNTVQYLRVADAVEHQIEGTTTGEVPDREGKPQF